MTKTEPKTVVVGPDTLLAALLAWDAWERAAARAADVTRETSAADYRSRVDAAWTEAERLRDAAKAYEAPRRLLHRTPEERVIAAALSHARAEAEDRIRAYTRDLTDAPSLGAAGEDVG